MYFYHCSALSSVYMQFYTSKIKISSYGFEFQYNIKSDMLESFSGVRKILFCGVKCNLNSNCRYFDYDASTRVCRTFLRGKVVASQFLTKQVGTINDIDFLYMSYGSACSPNNYEGNRYLKCNTSNLYQCHDRFSWNGSACIGNYLSVRN